MASVFREPQNRTVTSKPREDSMPQSPRNGLRRWSGAVLTAVRKAADNAMAQGYLLQADHDALIAAADASNVLR
jgi:hypothetical protein